MPYSIMEILYDAVENYNLQFYESEFEFTLAKQNLNIAQKFLKYQYTIDEKSKYLS